MPHVKYWTVGALAALMLTAGCGAAALGPNVHRAGNKTIAGMREGGHNVQSGTAKGKQGLKTAAKRSQRLGAKATKRGKRAVKKAGRKAVRFARRTKHQVGPGRKSTRGKSPAANDRRVKKHAKKIRASAQSRARMGVAARTTTGPVTVSMMALAPFSARYPQTR